MEETEEKNTKKKPTTVMDPSNTKPKAVAADAGASTLSKPVPSKVANAAKKKSKIHTKDDLVNDGRDGNQAKGKNKENEREKQKLKKRKQKESNDPTVLGAQYKH
jgi:hypothetical protein